MRSRKSVVSILSLIFVLALVVSGCAAPAADAPAADADAAATESEAPAADAESEPAEAAEKETIRIADTSFQTLWINNSIAKFAIENGYDYPVEIIELTGPMTQQSIVDGEIDLWTEVWRMNVMDWYNEVTEAGEMIDLGNMYERSTQGWYVPRFVIEGDEERGIEAMAPDLKSVHDLANYPELFQDPEEPDKGLLVNCITGWQCAKINRIKLNAYGLADQYNTMEPGASAALDAAIAAANVKGEPILTYYWEPTWLMGTYDMVKLEEPEWTEACDAELQAALNGEMEEDEVTEMAGCSYQTLGIHKAVTPSLPERAPEVVEMLEKMEVGTDPLNKTSAYMSAEESSADEAALWFYANYPDIWREWFPDEAEAKVEAALIEAGVEL